MHIMPPLLIVSKLYPNASSLSLMAMPYEASILTQVMVFIVVAWRLRSAKGYRKFY